MTQAPTPGPLDMDAATLALHEALGGNGWADSNYGYDELNSHRPELEAGVRAVLSLAPTAPVEASGSEREHGPKCWGKTSISDEMAHCYCGSTDLRPQPSGETRSAQIAAVMTALNSFHVLSGRVTSTQAEHVLASLDALSARPLASGGQHSSGEAAGCAESEVGRAVYERIEKLIYAKPGTPEGDELSFLAFLVESVEEVGGYDGPSASTPARAEAQDEGAAGEASAYRVRMISNDPAEWVLMHPEKALDFLSRKGWESQPLYAHPSPTAAADADRVRIACEIARDALKCEGPEHELIYQRDRSALDRIATGLNLQRAIAAVLKSERK